MSEQGDPDPRSEIDDQLHALVERVARTADGYGQLARKAFLARGLLSALLLISLAALSMLLLEDIIPVSRHWLGLLSLVPLVTFSVLQIVYPDRKAEAYRRTAVDFADLRLKLSLELLEPELPVDVDLIRRAYDQMNQILMNAPPMPGARFYQDQEQTRQETAT